MFVVHIIFLLYNTTLDFPKYQIEQYGISYLPLKISKITKNWFHFKLRLSGLYHGF